MAATKLTDRGVAAFETADARLDIWDEVVPGFGVRVTAHGTKTFFVRYRANGSNRRMKLGRYPVLTLADARKHAKEVLASTVLGADPALERRKRRAKDATFGALAREVLAAKAATTRASTRREREQVVRSDLLPEWGARPASGVERRDVALLVERIARRAPIKAGKTLAVIQWIYNEGLRRGFPGIEANPAHLLQPPVRPAVRTRFLDVDEIQTVWSLLDGESDATQCFFRFALLTAQRYGAVRAMRWPDIENGGTWRTPAAVFKGKRDHLTPLSAEALAALDKLRPLTGEGEYVFAGRAGGPRASIRTALTRLQQRSGIPRWTLHDFRRTFRTHAVRSPEDAGLGVAPNVADAVLGHKEASLGFDRYTGEPERYLLAEKRDALAKWGAFVAAAAVKDKR